jgi:hypothetical protein
MRERFRKRIEALEEARRQQTQPSFVIVFQCIDRYGQPLEATVASARDFVCRRGEGETLESFEARASQECLACHPRGMPPPILTFDVEPPNAA